KAKANGQDGGRSKGKRTAGPPRDVPPNVQKAVKEIRDFYQKGRDSLQKIPGDLGTRVASEAARLGLTAEKLRKARAFAQNYTPAQVEDLCRLAEERNFPLGVTLIMRHVSVPKERMHQFLREVIENGWTRQRINEEIDMRFGTT